MEITYKEIIQKALKETTEFIILIKTGRITEALELTDTVCTTLAEVNNYRNTVRTLQDVIDYIDLMNQLKQKQKILENITSLIK